MKPHVWGQYRVQMLNPGTVVSLRMDAVTLDLLGRCRDLGQFGSTTETLIEGLRVLSRELRQQQVREEIRCLSAPDHEQFRTFAMLGLDEWSENIARADRGEL